MANRPVMLKQSEAKRYLMAAKSAGYPRARVILHPDGRKELIAETLKAEANDNPLDSWRKSDGQSQD